MSKILTPDNTDPLDDLTPGQALANERELGQLAYNRLTILSALKAEVHPDSLNEQLREIERQMVVLGWNGKAHIVVKLGDGFRIKSAPKRDGNIIKVRPFKMSAFVNKYI